MTVPGTNNITQFNSQTVHNDVNHNEPHNELYANDNDLQTQITSLNSTVSNGFIVQLGQQVFTPSPVITSNVTLNNKWVINKVRASSKLLLHLDVQWEGGVFMHDSAGSYVQTWLRATPVSGSPADQGDPIYLAFYNVGGEDWAAFYSALSGSCFRIVTSGAGAVDVGYRVNIVNYDGRIPCRVTKMTLTYAELVVSI